MKKLLSALISLIMVCFVLPAIPAAAVTYTESLMLQSDGLHYGAEVEPLSENDPKLGGGSYSFAGGVLTLNNIHFETDAATALDLSVFSTPLTLEIIGTNSFVSTYSGIEDSAGIKAEGSITITGDGSLTAIGGTATNSNSYGIYSKNGDVIISDGYITATGGWAKYWSIGITSSNIEITGGNVAATGGSANYSYGIFAAFDIDISGSIITATGGTGISATRRFDISGGNITATGNTAGINSDNRLEITGGTVTATGDTGIHAAIRFDISGGNITAIGDIYGILTINFYISGGTVEATSGTLANDSYGIYALEKVEISGGNVIATGGTAKNSSGIYTDNDIEITGGIITATGGTESENSYGLNADAGDVIVSGGALTLRGETAAANAGTVKSAVTFLTEGRAAERLIYNEIDLTTVNYFEGYATLADYKKAYPDTPEEFFTAAVINDTPPPTPPAVTVPLTDFDNGENAGSITLAKKVKTVLRFNSKRLAQTEAYIADKWGATVLASFETQQKGGWGDIATLSVSLEDLGFKADNGTKLFVLIYDTKTKTWYQVEAVVIDGNVVIATEHSGVFAIVNEKVL
jgi:hypothetical protein